MNEWVFTLVGAAFVAFCIASPWAERLVGTAARAVERFIKGMKRRWAEGVEAGAFQSLTGAEVKAREADVTPRPLPAAFEVYGRTSFPVLTTGASWFHFDLSRGHWGVFGKTGSGKGNFIQLVALRALGLGPDVAEVVVLDMKSGLDYVAFEGIHHAAVCAGAGVGPGLDKLFEDMNLRLEILKRAKAKNIEAFNRNRTHEGAPVRPMSYVLVVLDEFADFEVADKKRVETLARMGRAAGIVLMVATQHPTADVLSTQISGNLTNRVCFGVASPRHVEVALARGRGEFGELDPSKFDRPGVAVLKVAGREQLATAPELTDARERAYVSRAVAAWDATYGPGTMVRVSSHPGGVFVPYNGSQGPSRGNEIMVNTPLHEAGVAWAEAVEPVKVDMELPSTLKVHRCRGCGRMEETEGEFRRVRGGGRYCSACFGNSKGK